MRRKVIAAVVLLGVAAIVEVVCVRRHDAAPTPEREVGSGGSWIAPRGARPSAKIDPRGSLRLEGQVIDARDSTPIAGAKVILRSSPPRTATTEADGSFAFDGLLARRYDVSATKGDLYGRAEARLSAASEPVVVRMQIGTTIAFRITARGTGAPIRGAHVRVDNDHTVDADAHGVAEVHGVSASFHWFEIAADGWSPASTDLMLDTVIGGTRTIPIELSRGAALAGTVVDPSGHPITDAAISISGPSYAGNVKTDATGAWRLPVLEAGDYAVSAKSDDFAPSDAVSLTLDGAHDQTGVVLRLARGSDATGTVVDEQGKPVAFAQVTLSYDHGGGSMINADADGRFAFRGMAHGTYKIFATSDSRASEAIAGDGVNPAADLRLTLADAMIAGVVVDDHGAPVAEASVVALSLGSGLYPDKSSDVTDSSGRFELGPLPRGTYQITAEWPGVGSDNEYLRLDDGVPVRSGARDLKLMLPATGKLTGVVRVAGKPLARCTIALDQHGFDFAAGTTMSTDAGRFTRSAVPPGTWRVGIAGDDIELHVIADVHVAAGKTTDLGVIDLPPARHAHGRVIDANGAPAAGAVVLAGKDVSIEPSGIADESWWLRGARVTTADSDGRFDLALPGSPRSPGLHDRRPLRIAARDADGARSQPVDVPEGDAEIVLQLLASGAIEGVVHDARGLADVSAESLDGGISNSAMTDADGRFEIDGLLPGRYKVTAEEEGMRWSPAVTVAVTADASATVTLAFPTDGVTLIVRGAHVDAGECYVALHDPTGDLGTPEALIDCGAEVELPNVEPGAYRLCLVHDCRPITVSAAPERQTIDLAATR